MAGTERQRELRRLRQRRKKVKLLLARASKGSGGEKQEIARKLRRMTSGADVIIAREKLA